MEIIEFNWLGWHLQEPMALVTNGFISLFCFYAYFRFKNVDNEANEYWKQFYLCFGIATYFGICGHLFFQYTDVYGKFPSWILGGLANAYAAIGMLKFRGFVIYNRWQVALVIVKTTILVALSLVFQKFIFVAIDTILTYIFYTGVFANVLRKRGIHSMIYMILGVVILLPSAFIYLLKINIHRWLNKDDFSHLLMLGAIICFYLAMRKWSVNPSIPLKNGK